jgi:hypothetical protein
LIEDINVLASKVGQLPQIIGEEALNRLIRDAELIVGIAQINCPVLTGNLRDSIKYMVAEDSDNRKMVVVTAGGLNVDYAGIVESKQPFLGPAVQEVLPQLKQDLESIQQVIDQHVK